MIAQRQTLRAAIEAHGRAVAAVSDAEATLTRASGFLYELNRRLGEFADVDARVAAERADAIRAAKASGTPPTFEMSAATKVAVAVRAAHEKQLAAAQQAVEALTADHDEAVKAVERASLESEWAAEAVAAAEAGELAREYYERLADLRGLYLTLAGISSAQVRRAPHEISKLRPQLMRPLAMPAAAANAVAAAEVVVETTNACRHIWRDQVRAAVAGWLAELKSDPAAELSVPREASAQAKARAA